MKKNLFLAAVIICIGATTFYFENKPLEQLGTQDLSSESIADSYMSHQIDKIKNSFQAVELENLNKFEVDGFWCTAQKKSRTGVAYGYKDKISDLLKKGASDPVKHYQVAYDDSKNTKFRIIDNGLASLYARLDLIRKAKSSVELEYFIYRMIHNRSIDKVETAMDFIKGEKEEQVNHSTILITRELIKKALQGVKVRVLIDASGTVLDFKDDYYTAAHIILRKEAEAMGLDYKKIKKNFVFKHYNMASKNKIEWLSTVNLRNHRKLLLVDDKYAMTGGRNIEDKYFDLDPRYNFHDRDVLVTYEPSGKPQAGGLLVAIKNSFNGYWNESYAAKEIPFVEGLDIFGDFKDMTEILGWSKAMTILMTDTSYVNNKVNTAGARNYNASSAKTCNKATYVTDKTIDRSIIAKRLFSLININPYKENYRFTGRVIEEIIKRSIQGENKNILLSSPYLSQNCRTKLITEQLLAAGATIDAYTNSLASTDAVYNASLFYKRADKFISYGAGLIAHSAEGIDREGIEYVPVKSHLEDKFVNPREKLWGLHSKSHVYGDSSIYIGTYNLDNRSSIYNTEMGVFCEDTKELATELRDKINYRINKAGLTIKNVEGDKPVAISNLTNKEVDPHGVVSDAEIKLMQRIFKYVEKFEFLF